MDSRTIAMRLLFLLAVRLALGAPLEDQASRQGNQVWLAEVKESAASNEDLDQFYKDQEHLSVHRQNSTSQVSSGSSADSSSILVTWLPGNFNEAWMIIGQLSSVEQWVGMLSQLGIFGRKSDKRNA